MSTISPPTSQPNSPVAGPQPSLGALRKTLMSHAGGHHAASADKPSPFNSCVIRSVSPNRVKTAVFEPDFASRAAEIREVRSSRSIANV